MITIGALAKQAGLRTSAVRYYESAGLLHSRRLPNGYRTYDQSAVSALRFVRRAQGLGITLKETGQLLDMWRSGRQPCGRVRDLAREHLLEIEARIRELRLLRKELQMVLGQSAPARRDADVCPMIEGAGVSATNGRSSGVRPRREKSRFGQNTLPGMRRRSSL
jgi:MerR family transcriptional regulator, copper efflux regulator